MLSDDFSNAIMASIAVNVCFMAIEHNDQPYELTRTVDIANIVFCMIFALEASHDDDAHTTMMHNLCPRGPLATDAQMVHTL